MRAKVLRRHTCHYRRNLGRAGARVLVLDRRSVCCQYRLIGGEQGWGSTFNNINGFFRRDFLANRFFIFSFVLIYGFSAFVFRFCSSPPNFLDIAPVVENSDFDFRDQRSNILGLDHILEIGIEQPRVNLGPLVDVNSVGRELSRRRTSETPVRDLVVVRHTVIGPSRDWPLHERAIFMSYHEYPRYPVVSGGGASSDWIGSLYCTGVIQFRREAVITHVENEV